MNTYNIFNENEPSTILYYAIARNEDEVRMLASDKEIDLEGLTIELERTFAKNQLGRDYSPSIKDAIVR